MESTRFSPRYSRYKWVIYSISIIGTAALILVSQYCPIEQSNLDLYVYFGMLQKMENITMDMTTHGDIAFRNDGILDFHVKSKL